MMNGAKVRQGLKRRQAQGINTSGKFPFGYCKKDGKAAPHPTEFKKARLRFDQLEEYGWNINRWLKETKTDGSTTGIQRWLNHEMLRGKAQGEWGAVKPLITWEEWEAAQRMILKRKPVRGRAGSTQVHLFTGLVRCSSCGKNLHVREDKWKNKSGTMSRMRLKCMNASCRWYGKGINEEVTKKLIAHALQAKVEEMSKSVPQLSTPEDPEELIELKAQLHEMKQLAERTGFDMSQQIFILEKRVAALTKLISKEPTSEDRWAEHASVFADQSVYLAGNHDRLRELIMEFVDSIVYTGKADRLEITLVG